MQVNPKEIYERQIVKFSEWTEIQQVGIDLSIMYDVEIPHGESKNLDFAETIELPEDMYATFHQRSSLSRKGIFTTTGVYDPGYVGSLGCTVYNLSGQVKKFKKGDRLGQILCFKADPASVYNGQWQGK